jgi:hypothetical protein
MVSDFFLPSKTTLLGYNSRSPWAFDVVESNRRLPKKAGKRYVEREVPVLFSLHTWFFKIGFLNQKKELHECSVFFMTK